MPCPTGRACSTSVARPATSPPSWRAAAGASRASRPIRSRPRGRDIEDAACRDELAALAPFDVVLLGDVLEHLRDPWATLRALTALGGRIVLSVPNVAHWTGRRALLRGRFPYAEHGLFDRTHLRFFTLASARALAEGAGLRIVAERFAPAPLPLQARVPALRALERVAVRVRPELFALQVLLICEAPGP
jgi:hypothetical protein